MKAALLLLLLISCATPTMQTTPSNDTNETLISEPTVNETVTEAVHEEVVRPAEVEKPLNLSQMNSTTCKESGHVWAFVDIPSFRGMRCMNRPIGDSVKEHCLAVGRHVWEFVLEYESYACLTLTRDTTQEKCETLGDKWERRGLTYDCYHYYDDASKICTNSGQCEGKICLVHHADKVAEAGRCVVDNTPYDPCGQYKNIEDARTGVARVCVN